MSIKFIIRILLTLILPVMAGAQELTIVSEDELPGYSFTPQQPLVLIKDLIRPIIPFTRRSTQRGKQHRIVH